MGHFNWPLTLADPRHLRTIRHELDTMIRQCVHGVVGGYEDLNDHEALQTATGEASVLAG